MAPTVGRYAPSPTGRLHLGNLRTALLAWLQVRLQGGKFLLRMEDLDAPRVVEGSADQILRDLEWLGLSWDGPVIWQSERTDAYIAVTMQELAHSFFMRSHRQINFCKCGQFSSLYIFVSE